MNRFFYSLMQTWHYRHHLSQVRHADSIINLQPQHLIDQGVRVLVLDFDGVLAAHGQTTPRQDVAQWLKTAVDVFGIEQIFILSNKPEQRRADYFAKHFPGLRFISGVRKKPYPDGLEKIIALSQMDFQQVLLVDDRLLTGVLAAQIAGVSVIHIQKPFVNCKKHPIAETFFMLLRRIENLLF